MKISFTVFLSIVFTFLSFTQDKQTQAYIDSAIQNNHNGTYLKAIGWGKKALQMARKSGDKKRLLLVEQELGSAYFNNIQFAESGTHYFNALGLARELKDQFKQADYLNAICCVYYAQGDFQKAKQYITQSIQLSDREKKQRVLHGSNYSYLGNIYYNLQKFDSAVYGYQKAIRIFEMLKDTADIIMNQQNLAGTFSKMGQYPKAQEMLDNALQVCLKRKIPSDIGYAYFMLGMHFMEINKYQKAAGEFGKAAHIMDSIQDYVYSSNCHLGWAQALTSMGDHKNALEHYKLHVQFRDSVFNKEQTRLMAEKEMTFTFKQEKLADSLKTAEREKETQLKNNEKLKRQKLFTYFSIAGLALMVLAAFLMLRNIKQKNKANTIIAAQKKEVEVKNLMIETRNKEITDSITYAKRIQYSLLAHKELMDQHLKNYFILFKPKDIVSGDFYWATVKNNDFYLAICDSTGHGVPGAFMSLLNISFLNEAIMEKNIHEPHQILNHVRSRLIQNMEGAKDGMDGTLIRFSGQKISYASANNRPVLIRNQTIQELEADKMPVGNGESMADFNLWTYEAQPGDTLYFYTDGFADQFGGPKGKKFKYKNLNELLLKLSVEPCDLIHQQLETTFTAWKGDLEQIDDICIVGIKI